MPVKTAAIDILPIPEEIGRLLVQQLKDLLNPQNEKVQKHYSLSISLTENVYTDQGILEDNTSTRATMQITANFKLKEKDKLLLDDSTFAASSYNILMTPYPSVTTENTTRKRLVDMLADKIAMRLAVYFNNQVDKK